LARSAGDDGEATSGLSAPVPVSAMLVLVLAAVGASVIVVPAT
jgi:hypothetical protein